MNHRFSYIAAAFVLSAITLRAEDSASTTPKEVPRYELKKRSKFENMEESARAPFWPIGWVKRTVSTPTQVEAPTAPAVHLDENSFKVTSILLGAGSTASLAVINGRAYSEGEFLRMPRGGATPAPRVRVQRIDDGRVTLQNGSETVVAPLQRQTLSERRSEEAYLDPNR